MIYLNAKQRMLFRQLSMIAIVLFAATGALAQQNDTVLLTNKKVYYSLAAAWEEPTQVFRLNLSRQHLKELPDSLFGLTELEELVLAGNQIEQLSPLLGHLKNLKILDLSNNRLTGLPPEIGKLTQLTHVYLKRNRIVALPTEMANLRALSELDLWGNRIIKLPMEMMALRGTLQTVDMRGISIKPEFRNIITEMLPETNVYFSGCNCN